MPKRTSDYRSEFLSDLKEPAEAVNYLNAALEDSEDTFLLALRDIVEAHQVVRVAGESGLARESLYRMLSPTGNPTYSSLKSILNAVGLSLSVRRAHSVQP